jgi:uncharacterized protein
MAKLLAALTVLSVCGCAFAADAKLRVLLLDGQNNHDWKSTTPMIKAALENSGRFEVKVLTMQGDLGDTKLSDYAVVVSNFTDFGVKPCPTKWMEELTQYVRLGGGFVAVHAATSGMDHYPEYARLVGMGWRAGDRLYVDEAGKTVRQEKGEGPATWHGAMFQWLITLRDVEHPICIGLPREWKHATDELWEAPRGSAENVQILATAVGQKTRQNEPVMWTVDYGKGRVFATLLGHDANSMKCVGFVTTLARGAEWAATGKVTIGVPEDFPTKEKTSEVGKK